MSAGLRPYGMVVAALLGLLGAGCGSGTPAADVQVGESAAPADLIEATWIVGFAPEASLGAYASEKGWVSLLMKRDYAEAVRQLGPAGGLPAARAHTEAAAVYRQAALVSAYGLVEVYGKTPEPTDPVGVAHLLTVSYAITGQIDAAKAESAKLEKVGSDPTGPWHAPWKAWLAGGSVWPPDLSTLPVKLPPPTPGEWPELTELPHYALAERGGSSAHRQMGDPSALVALASWHDAAAAAAVPTAVPLLQTLRAGYRLPIEPPPAPAGDLPPDLLFGSDHLVPGDAAFLAAVEGSAGPAAVDAYVSKSLIAWLAARSRVDGKINAEKAVDEVTALREVLVARSAAKAGGQELGHHRTFASIGYVGALRSLALVAEREGDREASGVLRINALEHSEKATACPVGLLALAAWDASNRYPMRAQDILHAQARRYPSIEIARYGLDVLGLRVGSERVGETPGM